MIETVVNSWNDSISHHFTDVGKMINNIATPIIERDKSSKFFPAIIKTDGNCEYPFADDDYQFGIYHRLLNIDYLKNQYKSYGDNSKIKAVAELMLICWGWMSFIDVLKMERTLYKLSPKLVLFGQVNFDRRQVFLGEFSGVNFFLPPELFLFSIRYKVQFTVDKNCLEI